MCWSSRTGLQQRVVELWSGQAGLRLRHLHRLVGRNLRGHGHHPAPVPTCPLPSKRPRPKATMGCVPSNSYQLIFTSKFIDLILVVSQFMHVFYFVWIGIWSMILILCTLTQNTSFCMYLVLLYGSNASFLILRYYFSLHAPSSKEEIYSSELQSTSNPNWVDIELENIKPINRQSLRGIVRQTITSLPSLRLNTTLLLPLHNDYTQRQTKTSFSLYTIYQSVHI